MDEYERKVLTILFSTNKTLHEAKTSNEYRLASITQINDEYRKTMEHVSISPLELPLQKIRNEIYNRLIFSREYVDFLSNIPSINIYDSAEIIVEIGDIGRFKNAKHFISYAGLAPVLQKNKKQYKVTKYGGGVPVANKKYDSINYCENLKVALTRCTQKMINNDIRGYKDYYDKRLQKYRHVHPMYNKNRLHLMALKKATIKFAKEVYTEFNNIKEVEDYEKIKYNIGD